MAEPRGHKSYVQIGTEGASTWGTPVASTQKLELISESVEIVPTVIDDPSLFDGRSHRSIIDGGIHAAGSMQFRGNYEGHLQLLRAALSTYTNALVETGVRDHTFKEGDGRSLTMQIGKGDIPTTKVFRFDGAKPRSFTFEVAANGMAKWDFDFLGKDLQSNITPTGALSFPAVLPILFSQIPSGGLGDGSGDTETDVKVKSIKITFNASLEDPEEAMFLGESANMGEPLPDDFVVTEWEFTQSFKTQALFNAARSRTVADLALFFRHPTTIGATSNREFEFTSANAKLVGYSNPVAGYGRLVSTARWRSFFNATDGGGLVIRVRNTEAALT